MRGSTHAPCLTGGGRIKHVRVLLGVPTLQILRFEKKKKFEKANKARTCFIRLFELFGKFFQSQFFFRFFFRPRGEFVAFPSQSRLVVGDIRKNGQNFSDLNFHKIRTTLSQHRKSSKSRIKHVRALFDAKKSKKPIFQMRALFDVRALFELPRLFAPPQ